MKTAKLIILDEVNIKFEDLDVKTRNKIYKELEYTIPYARYLPSYKLGKWDGKVSFANRGGKTALNLLHRVLPIIEEDGYTLDFEDNRKTYDLSFPEISETMFSNISWPEGHPHEGNPIILRDYQVDAIKTFVQNPQCIQEISTGAGKTLITACLSKLCEPHGRTVVIVPNRDLVTQTEADYKNIGLDVGVFFGGRREWNKTHTICTWQSLNALEKIEKNKKKDGKEVLTNEQISEFLNNVVAVIVDETHSAKGDVLRKMLMGPFAKCPIRWGLSGTIPKNDWEFLPILSSIGPVAHKIKAKELQDKNILANCHVKIIQTQEVISFRNYQEEYKFLVTNEDRLKTISILINKISKTGNTLVLLQRIKTGEDLQNLVENSVFIQGVTKSELRQKEYKSINTSDNKIILATYGVASVGINIPRIFNLVLIEPGKSFTRTIQSIGRGLRMAKDKDFVQIYDICASTKYSKKHLSERKAFYNEAQYPHTIEKIKYI